MSARTAPVVSILVLALAMPVPRLLAQGEAGGSPAPPEPTAPPELTASVNLLKGSLLAGQSIPVAVWLANPSPQRLDEVELHVQAPGFLWLAAADCSGVAGTSAPPEGTAPLLLGSIEPHQVLDRRLFLCAGPVVTEEDFNLLFVFRYRWQQSGREHSSFLAVERPVQIGLLGTGSVGGFSLRLIAFVLPGLLLLMILRIFKVPHTTEFSSAESAALAVLTSAVLIAIHSALAPLGASGISLSKLGVLCLLGVVPGLIAGLAAVSWRRRQAARERDAAQAQAAKVICRTDSPTEVLFKLLSSGQPLPTQNAVVRLAGSEAYIGSMMGRAADGDTVLIGWFEIERPESCDAAAEFEQASQRGDISALAQLARRAGLVPRTLDAIRKGDHGTTGESVRFFAAQDVTGAGPTDQGPGRPPLILAE